ncbi:MAG TPA: hypothetical protein VHD76_06450 [Bryobacteraceae bacterium]|jgi:hypothetical protein|nr:hypothetical protein [Bryobacteraceae bacterium]
MHFRRIACWLLGAWFLGSVAVSHITSGNLAAADRMLESTIPEIRSIAISRSRPIARGLLRAMAVELNRDYYAQWERLQLLLGAAVAAVLLADSRKRGLIILVISAMVLVAFQHFWVTPEILFFEQARTFPSQNSPPVPESSAGRMHMLYNAVEIAKLVLILLLAAILVKMQGKEHRSKRRRPRQPGDQNPMEPIEATGETAAQS